MSKSSRFVALLARLEGMGVVDPRQAIAQRRVLVAGSVVVNPSMLVRKDAPIRIKPPVQLRGSRKLREALDRFGIDAGGRVALDVGAAAGGFTEALLNAGAARVYAVDAGFGQLSGHLRQDPRVRNLERTNLGDLRPTLVPDEIGVVTMDLSYLSITRALPQLSHLRFEARAELVALVKPMFELGLSEAPSDGPTLQRAVTAAVFGCEAVGWKPASTLRSSVGGAGGAVEFFILARRSIT